MSAVILINLAENKKNLLEEMLLLSKQQAKLISDEKFENLEAVLNQKDQIIEDIDNIDLKFNDLITDKKLEDEKLANILLSTKQILIDIKTLDDENNRKLSEAMGDMKGEIKDIRQGMKAMQNYNNSDPYEAFASQGGTLFIDQDS